MGHNHLGKKASFWFCSGKTVIRFHKMATAKMIVEQTYALEGVQGLRSQPDFFSSE
jgi:hypothetical protein